MLRPDLPLERCLVLGAPLIFSVMLSSAKIQLKSSIAELVLDSPGAAEIPDLKGAELVLPPVRGPVNCWVQHWSQHGACGWQLQSKRQWLCQRGVQLGW